MVNSNMSVISKAAPLVRGSIGQSLRASGRHTLEVRGHACPDAGAFSIPILAARLRIE